MMGTWLCAASLLLLIGGVQAQTCQYLRTANTNIYGGNQTSDTSLDSCKATCDARQPACKSIDWDTITMRCYLHGKQTDQNSNIQGVDHYDRMCSGTGSTMMPPRPQSTECESSRDIAVDTSSLGGYHVPELTDVPKCDTACHKIGPACLGFDYSQTTGCWFHFNSTTYPQKYYQAGVTQYTLNRCPEESIYRCRAQFGSDGTVVDSCASICYPKWTRLENTAGSGGQVIYTQRNFTACLQYCFDNSDCVGVDYKNEPGSPSVCTYYTSSQSSALYNVMTKAFVTQYRLENRCFMNCTTYFEQKDNYRYRLQSPTMWYNANNQSECERACKLIETCTLYQFNKSSSASPRCMTADIYYVGSEVYDSTVYTGISRQNCNKTSLPPTPPVMGTTMKPPTDCETSRDISADTSSIGGYHVPELMDALKCDTACNIIGPACLGFDYSQTTGCWFHYNRTTFPDKYYQPGVTQFAFYRCPEESIYRCRAQFGSDGTVVDACASSCHPKWTRLENTAGSGGQVIYTISQRNFSACLQYCFDNSDCVGVDYSNEPGSPSVCTYYVWTQLSALYNVTTKAFVTQYRLENRCWIYCTTYLEQKDNYRYRMQSPTMLYNANNQSECARACKVSQTCLIYQFNKSGSASPRCVTADIYYEGSEVYDSTVITGIWRESCNETLLPPTPAGGSIPMSVSTTGVPGTCYWSPMSDTQILGGNETAADTVDACKQACLNRVNCVSIDFTPTNSPGSRCYLLATTTGKVPSQSGTTHYDYVCPDSRCWQKYPNTLIYGGLSNPAGSVYDCWKACTDRGKPACVSVDWSLTNAVGNQCFLLNTQMGKTPNQPGVDHYDYTC